MVRLRGVLEGERSVQRGARRKRAEAAVDGAEPRELRRCEVQQESLHLRVGKRFEKARVNRLRGILRLRRASIQHKGRWRK